MNAIEYVFWGAAAGVFYVYAGYPLLVFVWARLAAQAVQKRASEPTVSIVIAAYNEDKHIARTLDNKLALDYPISKIQIIVISDGSTDRTDAIAQSYTDRGVVYIRQEPRNGKTSALNKGVERVTGEVLVFADANSLYDTGALRHLVANFADPRVGYVTGKLGYANPDGSMTGDGCTMYMRYENFIRTCESGFGSIVGVNGGIDAVRSSLYEPMHADDLPDMVLPLRVVSKGYRVVYDAAATMSESANDNTRDEYRMRVRVSLRALRTLAAMPGLMNLARHGFYAVQVLSHKVLRYLAFAFMATTFISAAVLWPVSAIYRVAFLLHVAVAVCAWLGYMAERRGRPNRLLSVPYYFVLVNAAALHAFVKFIRGDSTRMWNPRLG